MRAFIAGLVIAAALATATIIALGAWDLSSERVLSTADTRL